MGAPDIAPLIPTARRGGRRRSVNVREVLDAVKTGPEALGDTRFGAGKKIKWRKRHILVDTLCMIRGRGLFGKHSGP